MNVPADPPTPHTSHTSRERAQASVHEPDEELIARLGRGDEDALRSLHHRYAALVFTVAARLVDGTTAEEVVQDVFVTLWRKHETFDAGRGTFKSWIIQIARRRALNELRRKHGRGQHSDEALAQLSDDAVEPDEASWLAHRRTVIQAAVDALPEAQRQALSLAFFDELTHEQIASVLHTPVGTTKTRDSARAEAPRSRAARRRRGDGGRTGRSTARAPGGPPRPGAEDGDGERRRPASPRARSGNTRRGARELPNAPGVRASPC